MRQCTGCANTLYTCNMWEWHMHKGESPTDKAIIPLADYLCKLGLAFIVVRR